MSLNSADRISAAKALRDVISGTDDPTVVAKRGDIGTLYVRKGTPALYQKQDSGLTTNWALVGGVGGNPLGSVLFVSPEGDDVGGDGSATNPFQTIQAALDSFGDATNAAEYLQPITVLVAPGNYDEDVLIPRGRIVSILGQGTWTLGDGQAGGFDSTVPRSVTFQPDSPSFADPATNNVRPALTLGVIEPSESSSTFIASSRTCHISGDVVVADPGGTSHTINLMGVKVWGSLLKTANVALTNLQMYRCYVRGVVNMPAGQSILEIAESSEFDGLVTVTQFNRCVHCEFDGGMTVSGAGNFLPPAGMFACDFSGTFTGPANSLRLDAVTNYFFNTNGAALAGGATKVLLHDETI